jgi:hypothetical protein
MKITFEVDGRIKFLYDDTTAQVAAEVGPLEVKRASHVEPYYGRSGSVVGWTADMSPVGGPVLPGECSAFATRQEALDAEQEWLVQHGIPVPA